MSKSSCGLFPQKERDQEKNKMKRKIKRLNRGNKKRRGEMKDELKHEVNCKIADINDDRRSKEKKEK